MANNTDEDVNLIDVYKDVIMEFLIPTQVFPYIRFLKKDMTVIAKVERDKGTAAAAELLLEKLTNCNELGWFRAFVTGLDRAGYSYLSGLLTDNVHVNDTDILRGLFHLYLPLLQNIIPSNIISHLRSLDCLSAADESEILATETCYGAYKGAVVLLDFVARKDKDWFAKLMFCLTQQGHSDMVAEILSEEAANAGTLKEMQGLIRKLENLHEKPLFKGIKSSEDDMELEHDLIFTSAAGDEGGKLCSVMPTAGRQSPEGAAAADENTLEKVLPSSTSTPAQTHALSRKETGPVDRHALISHYLTQSLNSEIFNVPAAEPSCASPPPISMDCNNSIELGDPPSSVAGPDTSPKILNTDPSTPEKGHSEELSLRNYQEELAQPAMDGKNVIVSAPTGSGKTHVALRITQHHFESADPEQDPKVVFIVPTQALVDQQWDMFKKYLGEYESTGISGDMDLEIPIEHLFQRYQIIILTPQILVDALKNKAVSSLSVFSLLMYDECHHTIKTHPYARIQYYYLDSKLRGQPTNLPQIVGLTASVGVGKKTKTNEKAVNHILRLCANLDAEELGTVERHRKELANFVNKPNNDKYQVHGRRDDHFFVCVSNMMKLIEEKMKFAEELKKVNDDQVVKQLTSPPSDRGSERYIEWLGKLRNPVACIPDQNVRRLYYSCTTHLDMYNRALLLNADCRAIDALEFIARTIGVLENSQADDTDKWLHRIFNDEEDYLQGISDDPGNTNPKLEKVKQVILKGAEKNPDLRCIVFVKTREMTVALAKWVNEDDQLEQLGANRLAGKGPSAINAGMKHAQQEDVLEYFKSGKYKVIVATTVAEEGLDIQKCNLVIRYEHVTNEIASVQARGRGRAEGAEYVVVGGTGTGTVEREEINLMREKTMEQAIKKIRAMDPETFHGRVLENQKEILMEWKRLERGNGRKGPRKDQEENIYELRCKKCDHFTCHSTDIRKIQDSHHVVMDLQVLNSVKIKAYPRPAKFNDFDSLGKLFCKNCGKDWGIQGLYKDNKFQIIAIRSFVVVNPDLSRDTFRQWKEVPFEVSTLTADELEEYEEDLVAQQQE